MIDSLGSPQSLLVLGGGSDIALATARTLVHDRCRRVVLAGRDRDRLESAAEELRAAGASVDVAAFDALDFTSHERVVGELVDLTGEVDVVLLAFGVLGDQDDADHDHDETLRIVQTNFTGAVSVLVPLRVRLQAQGHGTIVLLSSVAGERVRKSNFTYGASKAGIDAFAQGLGDRLEGSGVRVMIVRPGFVHTKMTTGMEAAPLSTSADAVASAIVQGLRRGADVVWVPPALRLVMSALRHTPRAVFRRLPL